MMAAAKLLEVEEECSTASSSSSIGKCSDVLSSERSMGEDESGENEAQSTYSGGSLNNMEALEEALPIRKSISKFYKGRSRSFASLTDAATCVSMKDVAKPENAYTRRHRNMMAFNHTWDKSRSSPLRSHGGGISKRSITLSRSSLALAVAMINSDSSSSFMSDDSTSSSNSTSPTPSLLPLSHPQNTVSLVAGPLYPPWRSYSLAYIQQHCTMAATEKMPTSSIGNEAAHQS